MSKVKQEESSLREKPEPVRPRRLADWINPEGERKVHSLVDKIYSKTNLALAWERVRCNGGSGGIDGQSIADFAAAADEQLERLHQELKEKRYQPRAVRQQLIPKAGQPGKFRPLGIPTIYDRVCQQAVLNRLEGIFEPIFDEANFGYRAGKSAKDALRKIWREIEEGREWIVDADLKDFFGSVDHEKLLTLINQRVSDGRVLGLIAQMLSAGVCVEGEVQPTPSGTPQGGVISPLLSNILLTPFDKEMRQRGHHLTRYADDWVVSCRSRKEAEKVMIDARRVLATLGVTLNEQKTRIVHISHGFEFLGYKIKRGTRRLRLPEHRVKSVQNGQVYAYPREKSIRSFIDQIRSRTKRTTPLDTVGLIAEINPVIRGWGNYYRKAHVRKLFAKLDRWILQRIWSHRTKRWRNTGWKKLPEKRLYGELGLVKLIHLIPSLQPSKRSPL
jgi:group II intron reverse transcriptase/maturase